MAKELTDEMIAQACAELLDAEIAAIEKQLEGQPPHQFSERHMKKMEQLFEIARQKEAEAKNNT